MARMTLTIKDFEPLLDKGYTKATNGNEYVYDFKLPDVPVIMKILSTVNVDPNKKGNKGSEQIRVFAVRVDNDNKIIGGYIKARRFIPTELWKQQLREAYIIVRKQVYVRVRRERLV